MELKDMAGEVAALRSRFSSFTTFRGYRSHSVGLTGFLGIAAAMVQADYLGQPSGHLANYINFWVGVALVNLFIIGAEFWYQWTQAPTPLGQRLTVLAIQKLVPSFAAGAVITATLLLQEPESGWMLPGLWSILCGLGVFSSASLLPRPIRWVGAYYLVAGSFCLLVGKGELAFSPWLMAGTFGVGQILGAVILHRTNETDR